MGISQHLVQRGVFDLRRPTVNTQDGDVRAVHGAAHVQAAGQGDAQLARQLRRAVEVLVQVVHDALDDAGGVGGRRVAVHPALGVDDVGDRVADAADRVAELLEIGDQRIDVGLRR